MGHHAVLRPCPRVPRPCVGVPRRPARRAPRPDPAVMGIEESATACLEEGCDVNMVADLIDELKEEYATVKNKEVFTLINKLEKLNKATSRSKKTMAEIGKIIGAASRSFSVVEGFDFPGEPIGYTGKVGTTTTAGKVM